MKGRPGSRGARSCPRSKTPLAFVAPMLPTLVDTPPSGEHWLHEIKQDGYRTQIVIEPGAIRAYTRRGADWTDKYKQVIADAAALKAKSAIIDGEMVVLDANGVSNFKAFRRAIKGRPAELVLVVFDLLHLDGADLRNQPLVARRERLHRLVGDAPASMQFSPHVEGDGRDFYAAVDAMGLEGMVSKRADSAYRSGRTEQWLKTKCYATSDLEVAGILAERGKPTVALMVDGHRNYVGGAFVDATRLQEEDARASDHQRLAATEGPEGEAGSAVAEPGLIARVRHLRDEEELRHASVKDIIAD